MIYFKILCRTLYMVFCSNNLISADPSALKAHMEIYKKQAKKGEIVVYEEILNKISDKYNPSFSLLVLPKAIKINKDTSTLFIPFYEGETFNAKWNEATGGSLLGLELATEIPEVIFELSQIDILMVFENKELKDIPRLIFSTEECMTEFDLIADRLHLAGLLTNREVVQARKIIQEKFTSPLILNNGDFYPRNLIRTSDNKLVLIDWETWNSNSRGNIIDHPENVAAFCFVHMWNNPAWQKKYVLKLRKRFSVTKRDFQRAILIKSLEMANFWFKENGDNTLCQSQLRIFKNALNTEYMNDLWFSLDDSHTSI